MEKPAASDAALIARFAADGDDRAFAELVRRHLPLVLAVTRRRLGGSHLAEDAAQQVFIALSRRVWKVRHIRCLAAWLQKVAVYEAASLARKESRHRRRIEQAGDLWPDPRGSGNSSALDDALAGLPERDRELLLLHHFEKLSYEQIGGRLGISAAAAQRRGHRAIARLGQRLRSQGIEKSEAACAVWLAGGLAPSGSTIPADLAARISAAKKSAAHAMPWIPIAASLVLAGGVWAAVEIIRSPIEPPPVTAALTAPRERPAPRERRVVADDHLGEDFREFIARAKADSKDAWEWVKSRPDGADRFFPEAVRHLADRDLPAAERLLDVVEAPSERSAIIGSIFYSRAAGNLDAAVIWIDTFAEPYERNSVFSAQSGFHSPDPWDQDHAGALKIARSPEVRRWLISNVAGKARGRDTRIIERLAEELQGEDRRIALCCVASLRLERNDPRAYEALDEAKPDDDDFLLIAPSSLIADNPGFCEWMMAQNDGADRHSMIRYHWETWSHRDAPAAAAWALEINRSGGIPPHGVRLTPTDPVTRRLMNAP